MSRVTVHVLDRYVVLEVDGALDAITGHDLRRVFASMLRSSVGEMTLDLSRVTAVTGDGVRALDWCSEHAIAAGRTLTWTGCSPPLTRDLQAQVRSAHTRPPLAG